MTTRLKTPPKNKKENHIQSLNQNFREIPQIPLVSIEFT